MDNRWRGNVRRKFAEVYKGQLTKRLGYKQFGEETIMKGAMPLYTLIYASKHERGLEFWNKIAKKDPGGQLGLF